MLARRKHPGGSNRLDDLCARYGIDNSRRTKHGALLDAENLAEVYIELIGARQAHARPCRQCMRRGCARHARRVGRARPQPLAPRHSADERAAHAPSSRRWAKPRCGGIRAGVRA